MSLSYLIGIMLASGGANQQIYYRKIYSSCYGIRLSGCSNEYLSNTYLEMCKMAVSDRGANAFNYAHNPSMTCQLFTCPEVGSELKFDIKASVFWRPFVWIKA
jgi:hypothetical protein